MVVQGAAMERGAGDYWGRGRGLGSGHQRPCWLPTGPSFLNWPFSLGAVPVFFVPSNITVSRFCKTSQGSLAMDTSRTRVWTQSSSAFH